MKQQFGLKVHIYFLFFLLKGFKITKKDNVLFLVDKKRWILISKIPKENILRFYFRKEILFKNPHKKGMFKVGKFSPHVCLFLV